MPDFAPADRSYAELMLTTLDLDHDFAPGDRYAIHWESGGFGRLYHVWCARPADPPRAGRDGKRVYVWMPPEGYWYDRLEAAGHGVQLWREEGGAYWAVCGGYPECPDYEAEAPSREEAAARLWMAVTGKA